MADLAPRTTGEALLDAGWEQGSLFEAGGIPVAFAALELGTWKLLETTFPSSEFLVVTTQTCDLLSENEPFVHAIRAHWTSEEKPLNAARKGNTTRYFLLGERKLAEKTEGLLADPTVGVYLAKSTALALSPSSPFTGLTDLRRRRFADWLALRVNRPPIDDDIVETLRPVVRKIEMLKKSDSKKRTLNSVEEIRFSAHRAAAAIEIQLLLVVDENPPDAEAQDELIGWLEQQFTEANGRLCGWTFKSLRGISAADYLATTPLLLEHLSH